MEIRDEEVEGGRRRKEQMMGEVWGKIEGGEKLSR